MRYLICLPAAGLWWCGGAAGWIPNETQAEQFSTEELNFELDLANEHTGLYGPCEVVEVVEVVGLTTDDVPGHAAE